nr:transport protein [Raoultella sp. NCTC 9187]
MIPTLRRSTIALLASSLLLTIGRGATLPFMTIFLTRQYQLGVDKIGYAMSIALTVGVVFSMGFGILADKFDKKRYMLVAVTAFICGFVAIPLVNSVPLVVFFFALINCAYSVFSTVLKAWFADVLTPEKKARIFSLNYTFLNIGWTVGPPLGTLLVMHSINLPFWLAAACAAFPLVFIQLFVQRTSAAIAADNASPWSPSVLLRDRALMWFTLSGCWRRLSAALSPPAFPSTCWWSPTATLPKKWWRSFCQSMPRVVVALQYAVGRRLNARNIRPLMTFGTLCFVIGLGRVYCFRQQPAAVGRVGGDFYPWRGYLCARRIYADRQHCAGGHEGQLFFRPVVRLAWRGVLIR